MPGNGMPLCIRITTTRALSKDTEGATPKSGFSFFYNTAFFVLIFWPSIGPAIKATSTRPFQSTSQAPSRTGGGIQ
jgi:hypothetical protein